jgi:signal transduction histidine kinase
MLRLQHEGSKTERLQWSPAVWERFHAESAELSVRAVGVVTMVCAALLLAWVPGDFDYFPEHAVRFIWFRLAAIAWAVICAIAASKLRRPSAKFFALWAWFIGWGAQSAAMIPYTPEDLLSHTVVLLIAQLGSLGILVWSWKWGLAMSLQLVAIGQIALSRVADGGYDTFAAQGYLVTCAAFCTVFTAVKYQGARQMFDQRIRLEEEKQRSEALLNRVSDMRQERLTWLENLARFLRHELKNQVVAVSTSLELANQTSPDTAAERYVDRAQRSLGRMRRLVDSATEATSLEAALATEETVPVELSEVVAERVALFREANTGRRFHAAIESGVLFDGNEDRLAQLLDKLLENAVDHGRAEGEIRVSLTREQSQVSIVVENECDALPAQREGLFDAFVTAGKQGADDQNSGLGLFVAKAIAESHGGTIEARDREGASGACFEVRLPVFR